MQTTYRAGARRALVGILAASAAGSGLVVAGVLDVGEPAVEIAAAQGGDDGTAPDTEHDHADHDHASTLGADGRFTGPDGVWPPEPKNATDVVELTFAGEEAVTDERQVAPAAAQAVVADQSTADAALAIDEVQVAVGERYNLIDVSDSEIVPGTDKDDEGNEATLVTFFGLDTNQTVEVFMDGTVMVELVISPAAEHQPPLSVTEKFEAAELARAHWEAEGEARIGELDGFAILAVESGGAYYGSRVAYVSFHAGDTDRPELITWVDLGAGTILKAEVDR